MKRLGMAAGVLAIVLGLCVIAGCSGEKTTSSATTTSTVTKDSAVSTTPETDTTTTVDTETSGTVDNDDSQEWTTVMELKGSDTEEITSDIFTLSGAPARITWKVESDSMWIIAAFVEAEGHDLQSQGGFPVFMESKEKQGSKTLKRGPGNYFLHVNVANSEWSVAVQEQK